MIELVAIPLVIIPLAIAWALIVATKGVCYFAGDVRSDNEKVVQMALEINWLAWPSKMHNLSYGRGQLREYWVLALKLLMKISGMKPSDHVNLVLALVANAVSAILVYYIASYYFGGLAGLFVFLLYVTCIWPYHVAIYMGHVLLSQALFLLSVLAITLTDSFPGAALPLYLAAGILISMSFSSSSSSRKFPFLMLVAFLYQNREFFVPPYSPEFSVEQLYTGWELAGFGGPALVLAGSAIFGKPIATTVVRLAGKRLGRSWTQDRYEELVDVTVRQVRGYAAWGMAIFGLLFLLQPDTRFYANATVVFAGLSIVAVHVLWPDFLANSLRYRLWMDQTNWVSHFQVWTAVHVEIFGRPLPKNYRGGGISWTPRFLMRMVPIIVVTYVAALLMLVGTTVARISSGELTTINGALTIISLIGVSLLPIIVSELTKALQLGKAYFPAFIGLLLLIGAGTSLIIEVVEGTSWAAGILVFVAAGLLLGQAGLTSRALASDVIPARMGPDRLYRFLKDHNIQSFFTYDNPYNLAFAKSMLYSHPDEFAVTYIDSITEANGGIVVVPPTSSKSVEMCSDRYAAGHGDFRDDPVLAKLLDTKEIERVALAKLDTKGCSRYFVHESEVTTYREIFLKQIGDHDRWLSHGWVLDARRLNEWSDSSA